MSRSSARPRIIEGARAVISARGAAAMTLTAVAEEAGITKKGLLYHFATKHDLLTAIHAELAARLELRMLEALGKEFTAATSRERSIAYIRATTSEATRADLALIAEADDEPDWVAPWDELNSRWFPDERDPDPPEDALRELVARIAADGLWIYETAPGGPAAPQLRARIVDHIIGLLA